MWHLAADLRFVDDDNRRAGYREKGGEEKRKTEPEGYLPRRPASGSLAEMGRLGIRREEGGTIHFLGELIRKGADGAAMGTGVVVIWERCERT